jgi:hypothetical protein
LQFILPIRKLRTRIRSNALEDVLDTRGAGVCDLRLTDRLYWRGSFEILATSDIRAGNNDFVDCSVFLRRGRSD